MAVAGIGVERDVAQHADVRHFVLDGADGAADQVVRIERLAAVLVAQAWVGVGEERDARDARASAARSASRTASIDRKPLDAGHGVDRHARCAARRPGTAARSGRRSVSTFSRTMRRAHSARRLRRGRVTRSSGALAVSTAAGTTRVRELDGATELDGHGKSPAATAPAISTGSRTGLPLRGTAGPERLRAGPCSGFIEWVQVPVGQTGLARCFAEPVRPAASLQRGERNC